MPSYAGYNAWHLALLWWATGKAMAGFDGGALLGRYHFLNCCQASSWPCYGGEGAKQLQVGKNRWEHGVLIMMSLATVEPHTFQLATVLGRNPSCLHLLQLLQPYPLQHNPAIKQHN